MEAEGGVCLVAVSDIALKTGSQKYYALADKVYISEPHFPTNLHAFIRFGVHNREQAALHQECTEQNSRHGFVTDHWSHRARPSDESCPRASQPPADHLQPFNALALNLQVKYARKPLYLRHRHGTTASTVLITLESASFQARMYI
jgi:hypothetical protein